MAEVNVNALSIMELTRRRDPDGTPAMIADVLAKDNAVLADAPWYPSTDNWANRTLQSASLPAGSWRGFNEGVSPENATTNEVWDVIGMLEAYSQVDDALLMGEANPMQTRSDEDMMFVSGLGLTQASAIFYSNHFATPKQFHGLAPRLNALAQSNVTGGGGTGSDLTSIYIVQWGKDGAYFTYPKFHKSYGINTEDLGKQTVRDSTGKMREAWVSHFMLYMGLVVRNPRSIQRYCNIESSGSSNIFDDDVLLAMLNQLPRGGRGAVIYCNQTVKTQMDINAKDKANVNYTVGNVWGASTTLFRGTPVRICESIVDTESAVA